MAPRKKVRLTPAELTHLVSERMKAEWTLDEAERILGELNKKVEAEQKRIDTLQNFIAETDTKISDYIVSHWNVAA